MFVMPRLSSQVSHEISAGVILAIALDMVVFFPFARGHRRGDGRSKTVCGIGGLGKLNIHSFPILLHALV